jgi:hypothetical protein
LQQKFGLPKIALAVQLPMGPYDALEHAAEDHHHHEHANERRHKHRAAARAVTMAAK